MKESLSVKFYIDASFTINRHYSKLQLGYMFTVNRGKVYWMSSKKSVVAQSTTESKYTIASEVAQESTLIKKSTRDLGIVSSIQDPLEVFCKHEGSIDLAKEPKSHKILGTLFADSSLFGIN